MKTIYLLALTCVLSFNTFAHSPKVVKPDVVYKINGDEMNGQVIKISNTMQDNPVNHPNKITILLFA